MNKQDRLFLFVTEAKIGIANTLLKSIDRNPQEDTGNLTFGNVRLSAVGQEPVTHSACNTAADIAYRTALYGTSHSPWMETYVESDGWTWETALSDMGLQVIEQVQL